MKVLLADDDPVTRRVARARLTALGYVVVECADGAEALAILSEQTPPRIAILDWEMPGMTGPEVCRTVRASRLNDAYTYVFLVTSRTDHDDLIAGLGAGVDDYLGKPLDYSELELRLRNARRILDLESRLRASRDAFEYQATHDALTGAFNRNAVLGTLRDELSRHQRGMAAPAVILADLDHFKSVNDRFGHGAGDTVLREAAMRMAGSLRPYDRLGRWGGEEFLFVLPGCNEIGAVHAAERFRRVLSSGPVSDEGRAIEVTASFGVAVPRDASEELERLVRRVDAALYRAKREGRNRVSAWTADLGD
ncbi:MAG TPA: diguanylate cyclase [Polyangia bacterium]|nr:diguanylate cyclase [Polyangia bacterium]